MQTQKTEMKGRGREGKGSKGKTASEKLTSWGRDDSFMVSTHCLRSCVSEGGKIISDPQKTQT
jgi:hypothetical protein